MTRLQTVFSLLRRSVLPRGSAFLLRMMASVIPAWRSYRAELVDSDFLYIDFRQSMCMGYFFYGEIPHEREVARVVKRYLPAGGTFIDAGANIGYYTRMASRLVGSRGRVYAFEPLPGALRLLEMNSRDLGNVTVFPCALGAREARHKLVVHSQGDMSSLAEVYDTRGLEAIDTEVRRLDAVVDATPVDLIKIDVEGYELPVLEGARQCIIRSKPVVVFEFIPEYQAQLGHGLADFVQYFGSIENAGYEVARISDAANDYLAIPAHIRNAPGNGTR